MIYFKIMTYSRAFLLLFVTIRLNISCPIHPKTSQHVRRDVVLTSQIHLKDKNPWKVCIAYMYNVFLEFLIHFNTQPQSHRRERQTYIGGRDRQRHTYPSHLAHTWFQHTWMQIVKFKSEIAIFHPLHIFHITSPPIVHPQRETTPPYPPPIPDFLPSHPGHCYYISHRDGKMWRCSR